MLVRNGKSDQTRRQSRSPIQICARREAMHTCVSRALRVRTRKVRCLCQADGGRDVRLEVAGGEDGKSGEGGIVTRTVRRERMRGGFPLCPRGEKEKRIARTRV